MTIAKLPLAEEIPSRGLRANHGRAVDAFDFAETPVNETLVRDRAGGDVLEQQRNVVLIHCPAGHCAAMSREGAARAPASRTSPSASPGPASEAAGGGRLFNVVDLVDKLDAEARTDRSSRRAPSVRARWTTPHR
ncbi:MAG: hypothetical protein V2I43_19460 [Parvularcula sp.]|jgi:hypothetical protein|nr:hypothetical protein [Parvularcula sp.]